MRTDDNEHVHLHELRGFSSDNLKGAFKEAEAISRGTKCRQYLFSLSLSPPALERASVDVFEHVIDRIEEKLGLSGQPRAIVFHEKEGRRHAHCVWSRIDAETMTARQLSFFKTKLMDVSRNLYLEMGWTMPRGLENPAERNPTNFSLAEWQQAKRQGLDPRWLKQALQECWKRSDNRQAFEFSLKERGLFLAKGDKRSFVVLDHNGEIHSLPRMLDLKTKDVGLRLGDGGNLASVDTTNKMIGERMTPAIRRHIDASRNMFRERSDMLGRQKSAITQAHREARRNLDSCQNTEWERETCARAARLPKGLRGLWYRIIGKYQETSRQNETEAQHTRDRQSNEREVLVHNQLKERETLQAKFKELRQEQAKLLLDLRRDIGRYLRFSSMDKMRGQTPSRSFDLGRQRSR